MASPKSIYKVTGLVFNATDYVNMGILAPSSKLIISQTTEKKPLADRLGSKTIVVNREMKIEGAMHEVTPKWLTRFTGGSLAAGALKYHRETLTKSGSNTLTLTYGAGANEAVVGIVRVYDTVNKTERYKAGSAVADNAYTLSGAVLTLHASDTGTTFEVTYLYSNSATTDSKIIIPSQTMPSVCRILMSHELHEVDAGTITRWTYDCAKCMPTGDLTLGGNAQEMAAIPISFDVINEVDGDVVLYTNGYNPTF